MAGGLVLTAAVCAQTRRFGVQKHLRIETTLLDNVLDALRSKLNVNIALLAAVVGLFNSSSEVNRQQFSTFFETVSLNTTQLKGVQGMGFARWIPADQLQSYESRIRSEGFPTFTVLPPGPRAHYSAIEFLEPFNWRNQRAFGFDMFSEPVRRQAMQRARHTGNANWCRKPRKTCNEACLFICRSLPIGGKCKRSLHKPYWAGPIPPYASTMW
jgi:CHASE1-domain containing sensor protein